MSKSKSQAAVTVLPQALACEQLRWHCDPDSFQFETTAELEAPDGVIGQDVAVEALRFGLETNAPGQNIFVRGLTGTGRSTLVRNLLQTIQPDCPLPQDRAYVYNFGQTDRPRLISVRRGRGRAFRRLVESFITFVREEFAKGLSSDV